MIKRKEGMEREREGGLEEGRVGRGREGEEGGRRWTQDPAEGQEHLAAQPSLPITGLSS